MKPHPRFSPWAVARHAVLLGGALIILMPFIWMISTASKPQTEIFSSSVHLIPQTFALWDNLRTAFVKADLWRILLNGLIVPVSLFVLQVLGALPAASAPSVLFGPVKPFRPSTTAIRMSLTSPFFYSVITESHNLAPSLSAIHSPKPSRRPSLLTPRAT